MVHVGSLRSALQAAIVWRDRSRRRASSTPGWVGADRHTGFNVVPQVSVMNTSPVGHCEVLLRNGACPDSLLGGKARLRAAHARLGPGHPPHHALHRQPAGVELMIERSHERRRRQVSARAGVVSEFTPCPAAISINRRVLKTAWMTPTWARVAHHETDDQGSCTDASAVLDGMQFWRRRMSPDTPLGASVPWRGAGLFAVRTRAPPDHRPQQSCDSRTWGQRGVPTRL